MWVPALVFIFVPAILRIMPGTDWGLRPHRYRPQQPLRESHSVYQQHPLGLLLTRSNNLRDSGLDKDCFFSWNMKSGKRKSPVLRYSERPFRVQALPHSFLPSACRLCVYISHLMLLRWLPTFKARRRGKGKASGKWAFYWLWKTFLETNFHLYSITQN